jgi:alcohol dehydrogenase class IV
MPQLVWKGQEGYEEFFRVLEEKEIKTLFLVCDKALPFLPLDFFFAKLKELDISICSLNDFDANPLYKSVVKGVEAFRRSGAKMIAAIGGGSAMDVAKCIKLYANMDPVRSYLEQEIVPNQVELFAIPTTAGTGSEATQYAVIYHQGEKQSISHPSCIPSMVLFDPTLLRTLPEYQKKSAMLDALCHGIESAWSVRSTPESLEDSFAAIQKVMAWMEPYLAGEDAAAEEMLLAANLAGKAINITQTTAAHAMSYKLTSFYGLAHGHSAALCLPHLWRYMREHPENCIDPRGAGHLSEIFGKIEKAMGCSEEKRGEEFFLELLQRLGIKSPENGSDEDIPALAVSVNPVRLKNNPVALDRTALENLYQNILAEEKGTEDGC